MGSDLGTTCPTCGDDFRTSNGMKQHHTKVHGESLVTIDVECLWCGEVEEVREKRRNEYERWFCSMDCRDEWQRNERTGDNTGHFSGYVEIECDRCGYVQQQTRAQARSNYGSRYGKGDYTGEDHYVIDGPCVDCEGDSEYRTKIPFGPNWVEQREKARERDGHECVSCGMTNEEHREQTGNALHVHHVTHREEFYDGEEFDHEAANDLGNLVTLCMSCHRHVEVGNIEAPAI